MINGDVTGAIDDVTVFFYLDILKEILQKPSNVTFKPIHRVNQIILTGIIISAWSDWWACHCDTSELSMLRSHHLK